jgi:NADPH:quinone reductase-like Zn-dependent oxidoreductase
MAALPSFPVALYHRTANTLPRYAEFTCVPVNQVQVIKKQFPWELLGALPEMMHTAWGSLFTSLRLQKDDHLLIRGGTTSVGLAAVAIAKGACAFVAVTTRRPERRAMLEANGADEVYIDNGSIEEEVKKRHPGKFSKILELVGVTTMEDSLKCAQDNGIVCLSGIAGGKVRMPFVREHCTAHHTPTPGWLDNC